MLYCEDGFELHVAKTQALDRGVRTPTVVTVEYSYHSLRREGDAVRNLFRYDNIHAQPGHLDRHHRHTFDAAGTEIEPPSSIGREHWPTLSQVIQELYDLWETWKRQRSSDE